MKNKGRITILFGLLLIAAALCLTLYNVFDGRRAEESAQRVVEILEKQPQTEPVGIPDHELNPKMEMPVKEIDGIAYIGTLRIPALELELPVISSWSYPYLKIAPCRYEGSVYLDNLVIAAHNYRSHFGKLNTLKPGDRVTFVDMDKNVFHYEVISLETLAPTDIEEMTFGDYDLTLFTCTIGGKSRITLRCDRVE